MGHYKNTMYTGPNCIDRSDRSPEARAERRPATRPYVGRWPSLPVCLVCEAEAPEGQLWADGICEECRR